VWLVLDGHGTVRVSSGATAVDLAVAGPGAYPAIEHPRHTAAVLELDVGRGVECLATCFTPGLA
jgi:hypothetical protein